ncbi:ThiF family adenylyltransferase [Variovorax sp.]|uniref:ThiF family adenylyltransferase n=1 Tax=Variovorax sp. TaxID=1871043 RepID=UPI003BAB99C8
MNYFQKNCAKGFEKIEGGVIYVDGEEIGLLKPSTLWGKDIRGNFYISGPLGIAQTTEDDGDTFWQALLSTDCFLFGTKFEIENCLELLKNPDSSRTTSFLAAKSKNCADLISKVERLKNGRVLIVGCGGIGSLTAINLAGAGVGYLVLVDGDSIELSNLNRQFFWCPSDKGKKKALVLQREILSRYPSMNCEAISEYLQEEKIREIATSFHAVVLTADEPLGLGSSMQSSPKTLYVGCGYIHQHISFGVNESKLNNTEEIKWQRTPFFIGPSFGPTNTELAGIASSYVIHFLAEEQPKSLGTPLGCIWDATEFPRRIFSTTECHER